MNFKKILLATAVALTASTSASALTLTGVAPQDLTPATEAKFSAKAFTGNHVFTLVSASALPVNTPVRMTVTLPAGVKFNTQVVSGDATPNGASSVTVASGGAPNTDTVTFLITATGAVTQVPIIADTYVEGCANLATSNLKVDLVVDASGTGIDGGTISTTAANNTVSPCQDAFTTTIAAATSPVLSLVTDYKAIGALPGTNTATYGTYIVATNTAAETDYAGTNAAGNGVTGVNFTVTAEDGSVFKEVNTGGQTDAFSGNSAVVAGATNGVASTNIDLEFNDITTVKQAQAAVQISAATLTLSALYEGPKAVADMAIAPLLRQVSPVGPFQWVSDANTISLFQVTGLSAPTTMVITATNSNVAGMDGMSWSGTVTPTEGELVLNSTTGFGIGATGYGRADILIEFESAGGVDAQRIMITKAGEVLNNIQ